MYNVHFVGKKCNSEVSVVIGECWDIQTTGSSSTSDDSSSNANDSSSNDGTTTTGSSSSSDDDDDSSDDGQATVDVTEEIQDTIPMDVDNEDYSPPRQRLTIPTMFKQMLDKENEELNLMTNKSYLE
eukprot:641242_1